jgi:hypothetical protein
MMAAKHPPKRNGGKSISALKQPTTATKYPPEATNDDGKAL